MSGSDRGGHIALVGSFVAAVFILAGTLFYAFHMGDLSGRKAAEAQGYSAQYPNETAQRVKECLLKADPVTVQDCAQEAVEAGHESQRSEAEAQAQRDAADWAFWMLVITWAQFPLTLGGLVALIVTIRQGREANEITREAMTAENRAWIDVEIVKAGNWEVCPDIFNFGVDVKLTNVGGSIARKVKVEAKLLISESDFGGSEDGVRQFSEGLSRRHGKYFSTDIFPGKDRAWGIDASLDRAELKAFRPDRPLTAVPANICVIAQYWTIFDAPDASPRQTCIIFSVRKREGDQFLIIGEHEAVAARDIALLHPGHDTGFVT